MTLITAVCSADWVALAADRRITASTRQGTTWQADADTKIAIVDGEYLVAYTGHVPTSDGVRGFELWLHQILLELKQDSLHDGLVDRLSSDVHLEGRRFMLIMNGFASSAFYRLPQADLGVISNSMKDDGDFSPHVDIHPFRAMHHTRVGDGEVSVMTEGEHVFEQDIDLHFKKRLMNFSELNDATLSVLCAAIGGFYTEISEGSEGRVGTDVSIAVLPRAAYGQGGITGIRIGLGDPGALARSAFRRHDGTLTDDYMPAVMSSSRPGSSGFGSTMQVRSKQNDSSGFGPVVHMTDDSPGDY